MDNEKLFKFILKCQRNHNKPDMHSFIIRGKDSTSYVECRQYEVFIVTYYNYGTEKQWTGTAVAAVYCMTGKRQNVRINARRLTSIRLIFFALIKCISHAQR